ncbi:uncharacterized protein LOC120902978 [Anopheles arabiensis]|uniref:uncharacterized protein LOC120902978 n=1 Tax=Anopheles arabiensis TaxID=7173 RepID=UPI001AADCB33|nr:uncharacterized protein LOC120902978 [Anopheles arabiensis]
MVKYRTVCLCLMLVLGASNGQGIYPDYLDTNLFDPQSSSEEMISPDNDVPSSLWYSTSYSLPLSPQFIDRNLTGSCTNTSTIVCTGCRRVRVCIPGISDQSLLPENNCPSGTYCNSIDAGTRGACLATVDPLFPECRYTTGIGEGNGANSGNKVGLLCTGLGVFPDPQDCMKFHYCTSVGSYARLFKCPSGYVYNSKKKTCSRNTRCQTVRCRPNGRSIFIPFPQDPTYYAYCNYNRRRNRPVLRNVVVYKCTEGSEFNSLSKSCVFKCSREGFLPKPGDPTKFYWCRRVSGNLFGYEQVCPGLGSLFSAKLGICLPPLVTTTTEMSQMMSESSSTTELIDQQTESSNLPTGSDEPVQLPPWPQWSSFPVSL